MYKRNLLLLLSFFLIESQIFAYDFVIDGIYFNRLSGTDNEVEVTYNSSYQMGYSNLSYTGDVIISESVNYEGKNYSVTAIGAHAFRDTEGVTSIKLPSSIKTIKQLAFYGCKELVSFVLPDNLESLENSAFRFCEKLESIVIPKSIKVIEHNTFDGCVNLKSIILPISLNTIESAAFSNCTSLLNISLPETLVTIGQVAFQYCSSLEEINLPASLSSIGRKAFQNCSNLVLVNSNISEPFHVGGAFENISSAAILYIPKGSTSKYVDKGWNYYFSKIIEKKDLYLISISSLGNGMVLYDGKSIRNENRDYKIEEGTSATLSFTPDAGYRIASVKVDGTDVTSSVSNNQYTISSISANTSVEVAFEAIPPTTYTLSVKSSGSGSVTYGTTTIKNQTKSFTVEEGTSATLSLTPDAGYRIASVKVDGTDVTSGVTNNQYTISGISANTSVEVSFEAIPPTTYTLSIKSSGSGSVTYGTTTIKNQTKSFTVEEGTSATMSFSPDAGYRIASVKVNGTDVTSGMSNNQYTISRISANTSVEVAFEAIPPTTYTLSVKSSGSGSVTYGTTTIKNQTKSFTVEEGTSATLSFTPDAGYRVANIKVDGTDVTSSVTNNQYTISSISANTSVEVAFEAIPPTTYALYVIASGNGKIICPENVEVRNETKTFRFEEGSEFNFEVLPDEGYSYLISSTAEEAYGGLSGGENKYKVYGIQNDANVNVRFYIIKYSLSITTSGNGSVSYSTSTIKNQTKSFEVEYGKSATLSFTPDAGYRIASVKVNGTDVTSDITNNQYTISSISANTSVEVAFEAIPPTTYTLSIKSSGSGYALYSSTTVREKTSTFTVTGGTSAQISLVPDEGYRVANVKVNNVDVTGAVSNNRYVISSITENTSMEVVFEAIPPTTYSLSIKAIGNGTVMYGNVTLKNQTQSFTVIDGSYAAMTITPENGYRIKHVLVNNQNVTSNISNNQYIVSSIHANTTVEVEFEEIPITTFTLTIKASGNGNIYYNNVTIKNQSKQYMVNEGVSVTITFSPDNGNSVNSVKVNGSDVTSAITGNRYFIESMTANTSVEVTFVEDVNALTVEGINYTVISQSQKTVKLAGGNIGQVLTVPASITQNGIKWTITEIDNSALVNNAELAAIIWNPSVPFTAEVNNPNLLLYVTDEQYAPTSIKNVIVNGIASNITLVDAASGNDFYCPQAFTAQKISYTHNYNMMTGLGESRGWETISLPFDVQTYTHVSKGNIVPFAIWKSGDTTKPFWLYELTGSGFVEAAGIKAYTPYIISLPNNPQYDEQWKLNGTVTFSASSVTIGKTEDMKTANFQDRTFVPNFASRDANEGFYALNAVNDYTVNNSGMTEGSRFVLNMRHIHPFEAYMTSTSNSRMFIDIFEGMATDIRQIQVPDDFDNQPVYNLQGQRIQVLKDGVYIINGNKYIKK